MDYEFVFSSFQYDEVNTHEIKKQPKGNEYILKHALLLLPPYCYFKVILKVAKKS